MEEDSRKEDGSKVESDRAAVSGLGMLVLPRLSGLDGKIAALSVMTVLPATTRNLYCTDCLKTKRFIERPKHYVCETCSKRYDRTDV